MSRNHRTLKCGMPRCWMARLPSHRPTEVNNVESWTVLKAATNLNVVLFKRKCRACSCCSSVFLRFQNDRAPHTSHITHNFHSPLLPLPPSFPCVSSSLCAFSSLSNWTWCLKPAAHATHRSTLLEQNIRSSQFNSLRHKRGMQWWHMFQNRLLEHHESIHRILN